MTVAAGSVAYRERGFDPARGTRRAARAAPGRVKLDRARAALVVIDVQEAFRPAVLDFDRGRRATRRVLVQGARMLGLPVLVTEQYPKGLGAHRAGGRRAPRRRRRRSRRSVFSAVDADGFTRPRASRRDQVLLCGIESHVCVNQTAEDLLADGVEVHVATRRGRLAHRRRTATSACTRWSSAGAVVTSVETALFELLRAAGTPEFKDVQQLVVSKPTAPTCCSRTARRFDGARRRRAPATPSARSSSTPRMTGYQEAVTDPSYAGQIITFTYPLIGNYGVTPEAMESDRTCTRAR